MTAPSLAQLRDIRLPPPPLLALVNGWIAAAVLALLAVSIWFAWRWMRRRALHAALRDLACLAAFHECDGDTGALASGMSRLVRRYAMLRFPQAGSAGLTGSAWLDFLDLHGGGGAFAHGVGAALATRPYQSSSNQELDTKALIALVRRWLKANPR